MSIIDKLSPERLVARARRVLRAQEQQPGHDAHEQQWITELAQAAWELENRLEVWEDYQAIKREGRA